MAIPQSDGSVILTTKVDTSGINKGMTSIKGIITKIGVSLGAAFSASVLLKFGKTAINLASDLQEVQNVVDVAFGNMAYRMEQFADTAIETFGISKLTAKQTGSSYMAMAKGMKIADDAAADMALTLTGLSADMASFYNIRQEEARTALSAVFTGETETLKRYGILITEVNLQEYARQQGITKSINAMTQQEKGMLRYQYILQATQLAQGDFVRTQDSWANQTRKLSERWKEMQTIFGKAFMNVAILVLPTINNLISGLTKVANVAKVASEWIYKALTGKELKTNTSNGGFLSEGTKEITDFGKAAETAQKQAESFTAGFDELNIVSKDFASLGVSDSLAESIPNISGGIIETIPQKSLDTSNIENGIERIFKKFEPLIKILSEDFKYVWDNLLVPFAKWNINEFALANLKVFNSIFKILANVLKNSQKTFKIFIDEFIKPLSEKVLEKIIYLMSEYSDLIEDVYADISSEDFWEDVETIAKELLPLLKIALSLLLDVLTEIFVLYVKLDFLPLKSGLRDLADIIGLVAAVLRGDLVDAFKHLWGLSVENRLKDISDSFKSIKDSVVNLGKEAKEYFDLIVKATKEKLTEIKEDVEPLFTVEKWEEILQGMVDGFANKWNEVYDFFDKNLPKWFDETIKPFFTKEKWEELLKNAKNAVKDLVIYFRDRFQNIWNYMKSWSDAEKWKELGRRIIRGIMNPIIDGINSIASKLNKFQINVPEIKGITSGFNFRFKLPSIPRLAQGAVIPGNREFLAVLGDQPAGQTNIETPLDTMIQAFKSALSDGGFGGETFVNFTIELDGDTLYKGVKKAEIKRAGISINNPAFAR